MAERIVRQRLRYSGDVQGVGFRATARAIAGKWRITGWVRNEPDGSVLLEAQGTAAQVAGFLKEIAVEQGQRISSFEQMDSNPVVSETSFAMRY
jgi:acylphosphatase